MRQLLKNLAFITKCVGTDRVLNTSLRYLKVTLIHRNSATSKGVWKLHWEKTFYQFTQKHKNYFRFIFLTRIGDLVDV